MIQGTTVIWIGSELLFMDYVMKNLILFLLQNVLTIS